MVSKQHPEQESESAPTQQSKQALPIPASGETCKCNQDAFYGKSCTDCRNLEKYSNSPKQYRRQFPEQQSEMRVCVELDLVAQTLRPKEQQKTPILLCNIAVNSKPTCSSFTTFIDDGSKSAERLQPEGREKTVEPTGGGEKKSPDSLDGMLDKISHDLDYLLNRNATEYIPPPPPLITPRSRGLPEVIQEEDEEEPAKVPDDITEISRTNC